jgi:hypothetical protein
MATQTVEFAAASGLTLTVKLFAAGSDTVVASVSATEATNRLGLYSAAYTDAAAGTYKLIALSGTTPVATWWVDLTLTTATFQSYEIPVSVIQSGLATQASVNAIPTTPMRGTDGANTVVPDAAGTIPSGMALETTSQTILTDTGTTIPALIPTAGAIADQVWDEATAGHTTSGTYGGRVVRSTNSNVEVQITGSNHIAADVHEFQTGVIQAVAFATDAITAAALAADAVTEIQSGLATQASVDVIDGIVDTILIDTNELQADWADGGRLDLKLDTVINISPMGVF